MTNVAGNRLIEIRMTKHTLFFTERELAHLLSRDPELWAAAIKRGKAIKRRNDERIKTKS